MTKPRVLVADDHGLVLARVLSLLKPNFEVVGTAANGRDLVLEAERLHPDLIVSDITMPILNGIEAAHELRERQSTAKFVFLSVHMGSAFVDACLGEGALGYVSKSRLGMDLVLAVQDALSGRRFISPGILLQSAKAGKNIA